MPQVTELVRRRPSSAHVVRCLSLEVVLQAAIRGRPRPGRGCGRGTVASVMPGRGGVRRLLHPILHLSCCTYTWQEEQSRLNPCLLSHRAVSFQKMLFLFNQNVYCTSFPNPTVPLGNLGWLPDDALHTGSHLSGLPGWEAAAQGVPLHNAHNGQFHLPHLVLPPSCLPGFVALPGARSTAGAG